LGRSLGVLITVYSKRRVREKTENDTNSLFADDFVEYKYERLQLRFTATWHLNHHRFVYTNSDKVFEAIDLSKDFFP
jgi:Txe/YoeB family toxin of Txe-Axe toxin-antitoxin module